jgi:hypothetical protein
LNEPSVRQYAGAYYPREWLNLTIADQRGVRNFAVSGHHDLWFGRSQLVEDAKPPAAVDVGVKGRKVREDGQHACLQQVTGEQHAIVDEDGLIAGTMRWTHAAQHGSVSAEVDLRLAVVVRSGSTNFTSSSVGPMSAMSPLNGSATLAWGGPIA